MYMNIKNQIYQEALMRINVIPNIIIETETGKYRIHDYIHTIKENGNHGGDFEISVVYNIFNINIAQYIIEKDIINYTINLSFVLYYNDTNNENKNLLILVNEAHLYFMFAYYNNNTIIDLNYKTVNINDNENNVNIITNIICNDTKLNLIDKQKITNKYMLKNLTKLPFNKILNYYEDNNNKLGDSISDSYYYTYHYNKSNKKEGKYSKNFNNK